MISIRSLMSGLLLGLCLMGTGSLAVPTQEAYASDSELRLVCRGSNRGPIVRKLRKDLRAKLEAADLDVRRITITLRLLAARTRSTFSHNFSDDITVNTSPFGVSFNGIVPSPEACTLSARLRIRAVLQDNSVSSTSQDLVLNGYLLPARNFPSGEQGLGGAE